MLLKEVLPDNIQVSEDYINSSEGELFPFRIDFIP